MCYNWLISQWLPYYFELFVSKILKWFLNWLYELHICIVVGLLFVIVQNFYSKNYVLTPRPQGPVKYFRYSTLFLLWSSYALGYKVAYYWWELMPATQLSKLDRMQHFTEQLCSSPFIPLQRHRHAAVIGLLYKLLDGLCREYLQVFYPAFLSSISLPQKSQHLNIPWPFLMLANSITTISLDLFCSYLGCTAEIWNNVYNWTTFIQLFVCNL